MNKLSTTKLLAFLLTFIIFVFAAHFLATSTFAQSKKPADCTTAVVCDQVNTQDLGFKIPSLGDILTFVIRGFFVVAGLAALFYMLLGAFAWVTSSGEKDAVSAAQQKITAAVVGLILIVGVLAVMWTLENVVFKRRICVGLTCPVTIPGLIETSTGEYWCCCAKDDGTLYGPKNIFAGEKCDQR